mmetsp:Transcript_41557/g.46317  ORF Transcript_41557/g.46317 Transcript_41557/m.46317 type:complete len:276 (-) Transcript_41557:21-848(-)
MMDTMIVRKHFGGSFVIITLTRMVCVFFIALLATTTIVVVQTNNNNNNNFNIITDAIATSFLRGEGMKFFAPITSTTTTGDREEEEKEVSYDSRPIATRILEEAEQEEVNEENDEEEEAQEEEEQQENEKDYEEYDDQNGNNEDGSMIDDDDDDEYNDLNFFETKVVDMRDRLDSDIAIMWQTSPSQWEEETWKDFLIVGGIVAGLVVACNLFLCCWACRRSGGGSSDSGSDSDSDSGFVKGVSKEEKKKTRRFGRNRSKDTYSKGNYAILSNEL